MTLWESALEQKIGSLRALPRASVRHEEIQLTTVIRLVSKYPSGFQVVAWESYFSEDPLWRQFGSVGSNDLSTPLFVVVDRIGKIAYAGSGGTDLDEIKKAVDDAIARPGSGLKGGEHP